MNAVCDYRTFDDFQPGKAIGETVISLTPELLSSWQQAAPDSSGEHLSPGLALALLMRGYGLGVDRRPPGNGHAGLEMEFLHGTLEDDELRVTVCCAEKELRKGRRWVRFDVEQWSGERCLARARLTLLWAR
ncbi:MAG: hypothetical protein LAT50_11245 [Ectothiorhodospiraceae bacterium]|nr:hypothetical protein [Ectothiorhodospiraceae bacterium]